MLLKRVLFGNDSYLYSNHHVQKKPVFGVYSKILKVKAFWAFTDEMAAVMNDHESVFSFKKM